MNGEAGSCTDNQESGSSCRPLCNVGYKLTGRSTCKDGVYTSATCDAVSNNKPLPDGIIEESENCTGVSPPSNGSLGTCTRTMKSNTTCKPKCDTGYSLKGSSYFLADPVVKSCGVDSETVKASKCLSAAKSLGVAGD